MFLLLQTACLQIYTMYYFFYDIHVADYLWLYDNSFNKQAVQENLSHV